MGAARSRQRFVFFEGFNERDFPQRTDSFFCGKRREAGVRMGYAGFYPGAGLHQKARNAPPGMPDCLEVHVIHSEEGIERSTAVIYGARAYLIHYEFRGRT